MKMDKRVDKVNKRIEVKIRKSTKYNKSQEIFIKHIKPKSNRPKKPNNNPTF